MKTDLIKKALTEQDCCELNIQNAGHSDYCDMPAAIAQLEELETIVTTAAATYRDATNAERERCAKVRTVPKGDDPYTQPHDWFVGFRIGQHDMASKIMDPD